jgi:hypothetical protein
MHTRNFNFSKIFTRSLWEKFLEEIVSEGENRMIKVNTMIAIMEMIEIEDEGLIPIRIVDGGDVSIGIGIGIRKEERPNFPSPIPPPPYLNLNLRWRWSRKCVLLNHQRCSFLLGESFLHPANAIRVNTVTMVFKLIQAAEKKWQRIHGYELLLVILSVEEFIDVDGELKVA